MPSPLSLLTLTAQLPAPYVAAPCRRCEKWQTAPALLLLTALLALLPPTAQPPARAVVSPEQQ